MDDPNAVQPAGVQTAIAPPNPGCAIRLVAVDLDGTLLDDSKKIDLPTVEALSALPSRGVKVVLASARPPRSVRGVYETLQLNTWQINYNGALIWDEKSRRVILHRPMAGALVRRIIDEARDSFEEVLVSCEVMDRWFTDQFEQTYTTETGKLFRPDVIAPLDEFCNQPITKLMFLGDSRLIMRLEAMVARQYGEQVAVVRSDMNLLQVMDRRVNKAIALRMLAGCYSVPMEQVLAVGDATNDVEMLEAAGVGVAMANAHDIVKQAADWVAPSNNEGGVRAALQRYCLCE